MTNTDTFTDEQLLNLINNTIIDKTQYKIDEFTGGYVSMTSTRGHTKETYKVALLFGYKNKNSQNFTIEIKKDLVYIWTKALLVKIAAMHVNDIGMDYNDLNGLMNVKKEEKEKEKEKMGEEKELSYDYRTITHCTSTSTQLPNTLIPPTSLPHVNNTYDSDVLTDSLSIKTFLDMKDFVIANRIGKDGKQLKFKFGKRYVSVSDKKIPYYRDSDQNNLDFAESDNFYKSMFRDMDETIKLIEEKC